MAENLIQRLLAKIPMPDLPSFTSDLKKDMEILTIYKENLLIYKACLDSACSTLFTTALTNSRILQDTYKLLEDHLKIVEKDTARLNGGFGVKFVIDQLGCQKLSLRISKEELSANFDQIRDSSVTYVEDNNQSVFIIRCDYQNKNFPISECPCCEQDSIASKDELIAHIKKCHITCKKFSKGKKRNEPKAFQSESVNLEDLRYEFSTATQNNLDREIGVLFEQNYPSQRQNQLKDAVIDYIQKKLQIQLPESELKKYGSSGNGFSLGDSDIDLCLLYNPKLAFKNKKYFKTVSKECGGESATLNLCELIILSKVCSALTSGSDKVSNLELRDSARVRVINFTTPTEPSFEVDICFNNRVALENTNLLKTYSLIDEKVLKIGIIVKIWARELKICDPPNGTLSSYAYVIMVIFFFQRIHVNPILPCLQENCKNQNLIDGHNCGFDSDYEKYIGQAKKNKDCEGKLLLDFFKFYATFDWSKNTVDIRTSQFTPKSARFGDFAISIQDPFEENRNLGDVVKSMDAANKIINSFKITFRDLSRGIEFSRLLGING